MPATIVWIDTQHARIFELDGDRVEHHGHHRHEPEHHTNHTVDAAHDSTHFYHQVAGKLRGASTIIVLGPGVAKDQFVHHLERHHHQDIARKILAVEAADHPTDAQIVAHARDVLAAHHLIA